MANRRLPLFKMPTSVRQEGLNTTQMSAWGPTSQTKLPPTCFVSPLAVVSMSPIRMRIQTHTHKYKNPQMSEWGYNIKHWKYFQTDSGSWKQRNRTQTNRHVHKRPLWSNRIDLLGDLIHGRVFSHFVLYSASRAHILAYSERVWKCVKLPKGIIDPLGLLLPSINQKKKASTPHLWDLQHQPLPQRLLITNCMVNWLAVTLRACIDFDVSLGSSRSLIKQTPASVRTGAVRSLRRGE